MALTGKDTKYYVARSKESSNEDTLTRTNTFTGYPGGATGFDNADAYDTFESAQSTAQWLNSAPVFIKQDYSYYVIQKDDNAFRLDENGGKVEEPTPTDGVSDEPTA